MNQESRQPNNRPIGQENSPSEQEITQSRLAKGHCGGKAISDKYHWERKR